MTRLQAVTGLILCSVAGFAAAGSSGLWLTHGDSAHRAEALALETEVDIRVTGMLATTEVRQRFFNNSGDWAEGHYRFPLPDQAAVERLQIKLGERLIEGEIKERKRAQATYEQARDAGQMAGLVAHDQGNLFSTRIANIPPGEAVEIRIGFRQAIAYEHGRFRLHFPTSSAPNFRPANRLDKELRETLAGALPNGLPERPLRLRVDLRPGVALEDIESSYHDVRVDPRGGEWLIELAEGPDLSGKDFELIWVPEDTGRAHSAVFAETDGGIEHLLLMLVPPPAFEASNTPREVILVIDTSGSMDNEPIEQARESLHYALASLTEGDRFNVIEFNHTARSLYPKPLEFDQHRLMEATDWIDRLRAGGGTDMGPPLALALASPPTDGFLRQVVFITDGMVGNERELLEQTRAELGESRLFTVGIGHGVNGAFLRRLADGGRGSYTAIAELSQIAGRMSDLIVQLESPVVHDIELDWPGRAEVYPHRLPDLYVGQPLMIAARVDALAGDLAVRGMSNGRFFEEFVPLEAFEPAPGVAAHWARSRIELLENARGGDLDDALIDDEILDTALDYGLVSSQTSLVAVDRTPMRSRQAALKRHRLATSPAHGRAAADAIRAMPATDAGSVPALVRGLMALLLVVLLLGHRRWAGETEERS